MLNIHSGTKYDTKTEMARAIYREIMSWADKDVDQMTQEEKKDMCMLAFTYKGLAVSGKPELPQTLQKVIAQATRDVTKGNQTERDQMEYEDRVEAGSHLTEEDVVIAISHSGSSKDIVDALKLAKETGATTITITNIRRI